MSFSSQSSLVLRVIGKSPMVAVTPEQVNLSKSSEKEMYNEIAEIPAQVVVTADQEVQKAVSYI